LIYGAQGDHPHVCYELLTSGADVTITNVYGINAYKAAILKNALTGIILFIINLINLSNLSITLFAAKAVIENFLIRKIVNLSPDIF
jgi:hypothetical protein